MRRHLESIVRQSGKRPKGLDGPKRPAGTEMIWRLFSDLSSARRWTDFGQPLAIPHTEIEAAFRVNNYRMTLNDVSLLRMLDHEYRMAMANAQSSADADDDWDAE